MQSADGVRCALVEFLNPLQQLPTTGQSLYRGLCEKRLCLHPPAHFRVFEVLHVAIGVAHFDAVILIDHWAHGGDRWGGGRVGCGHGRGGGHHEEECGKGGGRASQWMKHERWYRGGRWPQEYPRGAEAWSRAGNHVSCQCTDAARVGPRRPGVSAGLTISSVRRLRWLRIRRARGRRRCARTGGCDRRSADPGWCGTGIFE